MFKCRSVSILYSVILILNMIISMVFGVWMFNSHNSFVFEFDLLSLVSCNFLFVLYFDWMSLMFWSGVSWISFCVMIFSMSYMKSDKQNERFFSLVLVFVFSMFLMIFGLNLVSILLGWDGLGVVSYILVIYYQNESSSSAGMITALSNRVGDAAILVTIGLLVDSGSWSFMWSDTHSSLIIGIIIILAGMTKSAQIPFSPWLPAAMAAPTPVSALVHSSTLVTAGVYLLIRFNSFFVFEGLMMSIVIVGLITTLMASFGAIFEYDLKKIVALSTLSQLGVMMMILGLGEEVLAFFHLITHASFKALLFMCSGKVIHESKNSQDIRFMGGMLKGMPLTCMCINLSNLALVGFPFMAGFYSKDVFMELVFMDSPGWFLKLLFVFSLFFTTVYSVRFMYLSIFSFGAQAKLTGVGDSDNLVSLSSVFMVLTTISWGAIYSWLMISSPYMITISMEAKMCPLLCLFGGVLCGLMLSVVSVSKFNWMRELIIYPLMTMWFIPLFQNWMVNKSLSSGDFVNKLDYGWMESCSGQGILLKLEGLNKFLVLMHKNSLKIFLILLPLSFVFMFK